MRGAAGEGEEMICLICREESGDLVPLKLKGTDFRAHPLCLIAVAAKNPALATRGWKIAAGLHQENPEEETTH